MTRKGSLWEEWLQQEGMREEKGKEQQQNDQEGLLLTQKEELEVGQKQEEEGKWVPLVCCL